jgi:hypothetical protein
VIMFHTKNCVKFLGLWDLSLRSVSLEQEAHKTTLLKMLSLTRAPIGTAEHCNICMN